jgi:4-hydroxythreonine-4-phosphate dehydrogenase
MIHVSQGHEKSISLEVFLRSCFLLNSSQLSQILLHADAKSLEQNLKDLRFTYTLKDRELVLQGGIHIPWKSTQAKDSNPSLSSLESALKDIRHEDALVTLPTSKDQFPSSLAGHTEYLRKTYSKSDLAMTFFDGRHFTLLITDHVPLIKVPDAVTSESVFQKTTYAIKGIEKYFWPIEKMIFSGINPHAGEAGQLGTEDAKVTEAVLRLQDIYKGIGSIGPLSGDTLHNHAEVDKNCLFVYMHHDQALAPFKQKNLFWGSNITFGLPFLRLSVDHGTAFDLYAKKKSQFLGCYDVLLTALRTQRKIHGNH